MNFFKFRKSSELNRTPATILVEPQAAGKSEQYPKVLPKELNTPGVVQPRGPLIPGTKHGPNIDLTIPDNDNDSKASPRKRHTVMSFSPRSRFKKSPRNKEQDTTEAVPKSTDISSFGIPWMKSQTDPLHTWDYITVAVWIKYHIKYPHLFDIFIQNRISGKDLLHASDRSLLDIGVHSGSQRNEILNQIKDHVLGDSHNNIDTQSDIRPQNTKRSISPVQSNLSAGLFRFKFHFDGQNFIELLPKQTTFAELNTLVSRIFGKSMSMVYLDQDADLIRIVSDFDIQDAISQSNNSTIKIHIYAPLKSVTSDALNSANYNSPPSVLSPRTDSPPNSYFRSFENNLDANSDTLLTPTPQGQNNTNDSNGPPHDSTGASPNRKEPNDSPIVTASYSIPRSNSLDSLATLESIGYSSIVPMLSVQSAILQGLNYPSFVCGSTGVILLVNFSLLKYFGFFIYELVGQNISMLMEPESSMLHDQYIDQYSKQCSADPSIPLEHVSPIVVQKRDGSLFTVNFTLTTCTNCAMPTYLGVLSANTESPEDNSGLPILTDLSLIHDFVRPTISIDNNGIIQLCNYAAMKMFGYNSSDILGKHVNILMPERYGRNHDTYLFNFLKSLKPTTYANPPSLKHQQSICSIPSFASTHSGATTTSTKPLFCPIPHPVSTTSESHTESYISLHEFLNVYEDDDDISPNIHRKNCDNVDNKTVVLHAKNLPILTKSKKLVPCQLSVFLSNQIGSKYILSAHITPATSQNHIMSMEPGEFQSQLKNLDENQLPIVILDHTAMITGWNLAASYFFGRNQFEMIGRCVSLLIHPSCSETERLDFLSSLMLTGIKTLVGFQSFALLNGSQERKVPVHITSSIYNLSNGKTYFVLYIYPQNVTET